MIDNLPGLSWGSEQNYEITKVSTPPQPPGKSNAHFVCALRLIMGDHSLDVSTVLNSNTLYITIGFVTNLPFSYALHLGAVDQVHKGGCLLV